MTSNRGLSAAFKRLSSQPQPVMMTFWLVNGRAVYGARARFRTESDRQIDMLVRISEANQKCRLPGS